MKLKVIDLFSGLGGWTQSFMKSHKYTVERYDSDPWLRDVENTEIVDLTEKRISSYYSPHLLVGSPPCYEFSLAHSAPRSIAMRNGEEFSPSMDCVLAFREHVESLTPKFWLMENVKGSAEFINPIMGEPRQIIGPFILWGNFPLLDISESELKLIRTHKKQAGDKHRWSDHRGSYRAFIPERLAQALFRSVSSPTLEDWV